MPDVGGSGMLSWPILAPAALEAGVHALFSFPLQLDEASIGALDFYRDTPGALTPEQRSCRGACA